MTELLYLVDEEDNVLGSVERQKAHQIQALHRSGMVFLLNSHQQVFIQQRAQKETFPNCYDASSTFHVVFGESYEEAAWRESFEELGIRVNLQYVTKFIHDDPPEHQIVSVFVAYTDETPKIDNEEAYSGEWYSIEELEEIVSAKKITPWLREGFKALIEYLKDKRAKDK